MEQNEIALTDRYRRQQEIVGRYLRGQSMDAIAKALTMKRKDVKEHIDEWRDVAKNTVVIQDRAREAVLDLDEHFKIIIEGTHRAVADAEAANDYKAAGTLYKNLADIEAKRVEVLQKAGLLDDAAMGDQIAEAEEKFNEIKLMIKEVVNDCPKCRPEVARRLRQIFGAQEEPIVVDIQHADYEVHDE